jgi:hypothetical protein
MIKVIIITYSPCFWFSVATLDTLACNALDTVEKQIPTIATWFPVVYAMNLWNSALQFKNQLPFAAHFDNNDKKSFIGKWLLFTEYSILSAIHLANQAVDTFLVGKQSDANSDSDDESDDEDNVKPNVIREVKKLTSKIQKAVYQKASVKFQQLQRAIM